MTNSSDTSLCELAHRLPSSVVPSHYHLYVDASRLEEYLFRGTVDIDVQVSLSFVYSSIVIDPVLH